MSDHQNPVTDKSAQFHARIGNLAPGFRFMPTDTELFDFLLKKLMDVEDRIGSYIMEHDVYKFPPDRLQGVFPPNGAHSREWYFFVPRTIRRGNGDTTDRAVSGCDKKEIGHWKMSGKGKPKTDEPLAVNQVMQKLVYISGFPRPVAVKTNWHMMEYRIKLDPEKLRIKGKQDFVLCKIYYKSKSGKDDDGVQLITDGVVAPAVMPPQTQPLKERESRFHQEGQTINHYKNCCSNDCKHRRRRLHHQLPSLESGTGQVAGTAALGFDQGGVNNTSLNGKNGGGQLVQVQTPVMIQNGPTGPGYIWANCNNLGLEQSVTGLETTTEVFGPIQVIDYYGKSPTISDADYVRRFSNEYSLPEDSEFGGPNLEGSS